MKGHFGLDIGSETLKLVQLEKAERKFRLVTAGMVKNPLMGFFSDEEKDMLPLAETIKKLASETKVSARNAVISLPERKIFTQVIEVPKMNEKELEQAIPWQAESIVPKPLAEVNLDWEIVEDKELEKENKLAVLLVAAPSALVKNYLKILKMAGFGTVGVETEVLALLRCLKPVVNGKPAVFLNFGEKTADIFIARNNGLFMSRSLPTAGESISRAISIALSLDLPTAAEYKKAYGLSGEFEGKIAAAVETVLSNLADEIKKAIHFYETKKNEQIKLLVLTGGSANLPGLTEYLAKTLGLEIQMFDPFSLISADPDTLTLLKKDAFFYPVAVGLAMKEV